MRLGKTWPMNVGITGGGNRLVAFRFIRYDEKKIIISWGLAKMLHASPIRDTESASVGEQFR